MLCAGAYSLVLEAAAAEPSVESVTAACQAALALGAWGQAASWAERGLDLAPDSQTLCLFGGLALLRTGDLLRAERFLVRFLNNPTPVLQGDALYALGELLLLLGRPAEAVQRLDKAAAIFRQQGRCRQALACEVEATWVLLVDDQPERARPRLEAAVRLLQEQGDRPLQARAALNWACYHLRAGARKEAERYCADLQVGHDLPVSHRADLHWILGACALAEGAVSDALRHSALAAEAAAEHWWPPQMGRIDSLRAQLLRRGAAV